MIDGDLGAYPLTPNAFGFLMDYYIAKEKIPVLPRKNE